jgi:hypothetical protein
LVEVDLSLQRPVQTYGVRVGSDIDRQGLGIAVQEGILPDMLVRCPAARGYKRDQSRNKNMFLRHYFKKKEPVFDGTGSHW